MEQINWDFIEPNGWHSEYDKIDIILSHLSYLRKQLEYFSGQGRQGKELLSSEEHMSYEQWYALFEPIPKLYRTMTKVNSIRALYKMIIHKGIENLNVFIKNFPNHLNFQEITRKWFVQLLYVVKPDGDLGIGTGDDKFTRSILDNLLIVALTLKSEQYLTWVAEARIPDDPRSQQAYIRMYIDQVQ